MPKGVNEEGRDPEVKSEQGTPNQRAAVGLGTNMVSAFVLFGIVGYYLDFKRGSGFVWTGCGMLLASVICGYEVWKLVRRLDEEERQKQLNKGNESPPEHERGHNNTPSGHSPDS